MNAICLKYGYKFKLSKEDDEYIAKGKLGQLYEFGDFEMPDGSVVSMIGAMFMPTTEQNGWTARRKTLLAAGGVLKQNGDKEGVVLVPVKDGKLVRLAARLMGVRTKREMSPEKKAELTERLAKARKAKK